MIIRYVKILTMLLLNSNIALANNNFFKDGVDLFNSKKLDEAKFKFEQDIVQNPKSENSYLYLAKIFYNQKQRLIDHKKLYILK